MKNARDDVEAAKKVAVCATRAATALRLNYSYDYPQNEAP